MAQINDAARQQAMQMTWHESEDVDALEYADASDTKAVRWKAAMDIAKNNITGDTYRIGLSAAGKHGIHAPASGGC